MVGYAGGDAFFPLGMGVLLALVGIAIALEKTYQIKNLPIVGVLFAIAGAAMIVGFFVDSFSNETGDNGDNLFGMIGWMSWMLMSVVLGVLRLRASD
jgi:threonine/homoserine efflux transporter RhtA